MDDLVNIMPADLLGNGTACLVWSSSFPDDAHNPMCYVNLIGDQKPHLLVKTVNNLGAETRVQYAPSTKFYLQDKFAGTPWIIRLPFPVHVVERVETYDHISRNRFITRYSYHHGYFDGVEREFRGFGRVEQWDTEEIGSLDETSEPTANEDLSFRLPPVHTKTWYHTGAYLTGAQISLHYKKEYYREPGLPSEDADTLLLPDTILPPGLSADEEAEAYRALRGTMLRQEVYAKDAGPDAIKEQIERAQTPYTITEQNFSLRYLQPRGDNLHAVFFSHPREAFNCHYERDPVDPRITHSLTLKVDEFGNTLRSAAIAYGRRQDAPEPWLSDEERLQQRLVHITYEENLYTNAIDFPDDYRIPQSAESCSYELRKAKQDQSPDGLIPLFSYNTVQSLVDQAGDGAHDITYEDLNFRAAHDAIRQESAKSQDYFRRKVEHSRIYYRRNDLAALLPIYELESQALPGESYQLAFTPGLLEQIYVRPLDAVTSPTPSESLLPADDLADILQKEGGYIEANNGHWWIPSGRIYFHRYSDVTADIERREARSNFYMPRRFQDPFGNNSFVDYDNYNLMPTCTEDAVHNCVSSINDYRFLQPKEITGPNGNRSRVAFDAIGLVVATAVMGKVGEPVGDLLDDEFDADSSPKGIQAFFNDPLAKKNDKQTIAAIMLGKASTRTIYDLDRFKRSNQPAAAATLARENHYQDTGDNTRIQVSFSYSDGFGREIQKKIQAEPGKAPQRFPVSNLPLGDVHPGSLLRDDEGQLIQSNNPFRWVGTGRNVFNNKGKPVKQYEPFFSTTHLFETEREMTETGVTPILFYDPLVRVVANLHPNHTYEKVLFNPWQQTNYDVNDTCAPLNQQTGDPRTDPDIKGYVNEYFQSLSNAPGNRWQTWYQQRINGKKGKQEQTAAQKAATHADTPTTIHLDSLGRQFLSIANNGLDDEGQPQRYETRIVFDIEGNEREVIDAKGRIVMRYAYNMAGPEESEDDEEEEAVNRIHQSSMEAGERWILNDVAGNPIRSWDSRGHVFTSQYDELRRPVRLLLLGTDPREHFSDPRTIKDGDQPHILFERIDYGEGETDDINRNLRGQVVRQYDGAGIVTSSRYDFKGNLLDSSRQLCRKHREIPNWSQKPELEQEMFSSSSRFDALNRPTQVIAPHSNQGSPQVNILQPGYNEAGLLERMDVWLEQEEEPGQLLNRTQKPPDLPAIDNIDYNAKGQRELIQYGNGSQTRYFYDKETFRLTNLLTTRGSHDVAIECNPKETSDRDCVDPPDICTKLSTNKCVLQNLSYIYDPVGNITHIRDDAQQLIFFRNSKVEPSTSYTYDPLYRLTTAKGREHLGQNADGQRKSPTPHSHSDTQRTGLLHPANSKAMGPYREQYFYDEVGNIMEMIHRSLTPGLEPRDWTRENKYKELSQIDENAFYGAVSNRLTSSTVQDHTEKFLYDEHGNMLSMGHLEKMLWDFKDQLLMTRRIQNNDPNNEGDGTWYVYDGSGERVRNPTRISHRMGEVQERQDRRLY